MVWLLTVWATTTRQMQAASWPLQGKLAGKSPSLLYRDGAGEARRDEVKLLGTKGCPRTKTRLPGLLEEDKSQQVRDNIAESTMQASLRH